MERGSSGTLDHAFTDDYESRDYKYYPLTGFGTAMKKTISALIVILIAVLIVTSYMNRPDRQVDGIGDPPVDRSVRPAQPAGVAVVSNSRERSQNSSATGPYSTMDACELIDGYKAGMSPDDVKSLYQKTSAEPLQCGPILPYSAPNAGSELVCTGTTNFDASVRVNFHFGIPNREEVNRGVLSLIDGDFDPQDFGRVKHGFIERLGNPNGDEVCDRSKLSCAELANVDQVGGCEALFWSNRSLPIELTQVPMLNGSRFSVLPTPDGRGRSA
jgi:hypothetical protein